MRKLTVSNLLLRLGPPVLFALCGSVFAATSNTSEAADAARRNLNPCASPPDFGPLPAAPTVSGDYVGSISMSTPKDGWLRTTTYNRPVYGAGDFGPWGNPVVSFVPPGDEPDQCRHIGSMAQRNPAP